MVSVLSKNANWLWEDSSQTAGSAIDSLVSIPPLSDLISTPFSGDGDRDRDDPFIAQFNALAPTPSVNIN